MSSLGDKMLGLIEILLVVIVVVIVVVVLGLIGLAYIAAAKLLKPPRRIYKWTPKDLGYDFEELIIKSNGVDLHGWFIDRGSNVTILAIHGYTSSKWDETYMKPVINILAENGFNVAAFDFRAHGRSGGEITTLGYLETQDYKNIISWLKQNKPEKAEKIGLIGYSMGGAVTIMLTALDDRIDFAIADSPYIDIVSSGKRWIMRMKGIIRSILLAVYPLIVFFAAKKAGINVDDLKLYKYADKIKKPLFIIAGKNDDLVSIDEIKKFYELVSKHNEHVDIWITDSQHVRAIQDYPKEYEEKIISFYKRRL